MSQTATTHVIDQWGARFRDAADELEVNPFDPKVAAAVRLVADSILATGMAFEPDPADAYYCSAMAWRELVQ